MELDAKTIINLLDSTEWEPNSCLRLFWVKIAQGSRDTLAADLKQTLSSDVVVPLVLRETLFLNANAVMSDFARLLDNNRQSFEGVQVGKGEKLTVILLLKENFKLAQISSPVGLPRWFPVSGGIETYLRIADLLWSAETELLNCADAQIESMATGLYELECSLVERLRQVSDVDDRKLRSLVSSICENAGSATETLDKFELTLKSVTDPKSYRPNSTSKNSLISLIFSQVLKSSPDKLASLAAKFSDATSDNSTDVLQPTLFAIMLRPTHKSDPAIKNWHSILLAAFQVYQLMNASAHAGEYPKYPVSLVHSNSRDLLRFLHTANHYVAILFAETELNV